MSFAIIAEGGDLFSPREVECVGYAVYNFYLWEALCCSDEVGCFDRGFEFQSCLLLRKVMGSVGVGSIGPAVCRVILLCV